MAGMMTTGSMKAVGQGLLRTGTRSLASQASKSALSLHQSLLNAPETKVTPFSNGVRVASETHAGGETATVGVWIEAGTRDETEANHGASHLIERLIFKGHGKKTQADLEREVESMGGQLHAYTTRDHTAIYAKVLKGDVPKAVNLLSEIVQNTNFSTDAVEKEKQKVIKSISESESETQEVLFDHLYATAFQGSSLGRNLTGTAKSVASLTASDLGAFVKDNFAGSRIVVSGAGAVNHDELAKLAESTFGKLPAGAPRKAQRSRFVGSEIRLRDDTVDDAHILFAAESVGASHPDYYPMMVAQFILGSWDSSLGGGKNLASKLSQHIAEHGLCHSYTTFNTSFADTGLFGLYITSSSRTRLDDLMYQFQQEWVRLGVNVSEGEAEIAKNQLKAALLMRLNSTSSIATDIGTSILLRDQRPSLHETLSQIDAVTASSVQKAAYKHLYDRDPAVVAYGPIEGFPDYNRVQTATSWLRV